MLSPEVVIATYSAFVGNIQHLSALMFCLCTAAAETYRFSSFFNTNINSARIDQEWKRVKESILKVVFPESRLSPGSPRQGKHRKREEKKSRNKIFLQRLHMRYIYNAI
jgi:hypothetical protein